MANVKLKVCGIRRKEDIGYASKADMLGFVVEAPKSPRSLFEEEVAELVMFVPKGVETVAVTIHTEAERIARIVMETGVSAVQIHSDITETELAKVRTLLPPPKKIFVLVAVGEDETAAIERAKSIAGGGAADAIILDTMARDNIERAPGDSWEGPDKDDEDWHKRFQDGSAPKIIPELELQNAVMGARSEKNAEMKDAKIVEAPKSALGVSDGMGKRAETPDTVLKVSGGVEKSADAPAEQHVPEIPLTGGTGKTHDWRISRKVRDAVHPFPVILAGGLSAENVKEAIRVVEPWAVDVSSSLEVRYYKSKELIDELMKALGR